MSCIVVFGPVAAGKSTLTAALVAAMPGAILLPEPTAKLQELGLIGDLAAGRAGTGLAIQLTVMLARLNGILDITAAKQGVRGAQPPAVCDGHALLDGQLYLPEHIRAGRMNITDVCVHAHALSVVKRMLPRPFAEPTLYVYLRTSADVCLQRCRQRARPGERVLDLPFFQRMLANCDAAAEQLPSDRLICIGDDSDMSIGDLAAYISTRAGAIV